MEKSILKEEKFEVNFLSQRLNELFVKENIAGLIVKHSHDLAKKELKKRQRR